MTEEEEFSVEQLEKMIEDTVIRNAEDNAKISSQKKVLRELSDQLTAIKKAVEEAEKSAQENRKAIQKLEMEKLKAERRERLAAQKKALEEQFDIESKKLDDLTIGAKWREFAFEHQIEGAKKLAIAKRGILGDKRGLGKTLTSLVWADMIQAKRILVLAPNDVVPQFEDEVRTWAPQRTIFSMRGLNPMARATMYPLLGIVPEFIVTLNYEAWRRDKSIIDDLLAVGIDTIICDEAHRIKTADKLTARGVFQLIHRPNKCESCGEGYEKVAGKWDGVDNYTSCSSCGSIRTSSTVENVLMMTGTPILNRPQELFSLVHAVDRHTFEDMAGFLRAFCYHLGGSNWTFKPGGLDDLVKKMSHFFLQRDRNSTGIKVPPPAITVHEVIKDEVRYPLQYEAEERIKNAAQLMLQSGESVSILNIMELILRERQCMTWPAGIRMNIKDDDGNIVDVLKFDIEESQKLDESYDLLTELCEEEERVVVFSQFKAPLYEFRRRLEQAGISVAMATGDQSEIHKRQVQQDFDLKTAPEKPRYQVCLATYKAFGTGINLNAARQMILLDDEWNPGMEDQAIGRIDRLNSIDQANVHIFRVKDSIDDFMAGILERKRKTVTKFNDTVTAAELLEFFKDDNGN